jgi:hypothetical protein
MKCGTKDCNEVKFGYCLSAIQGYECGNRPKEKVKFKEKVTGMGDDQEYKIMTKYLNNIE